MIPNPFKSQARLLLELGVITPEEYVVMRADGRFSRAIVVSAVVMITLYAVAICQFTFLNIQNHTNVFPPVEFTTGYFAFWTVEVVMLATIKRSKVKNKHEREDSSGDILARAMRRVSPGETETIETAPEEVANGDPDNRRQ